MRSGTLTASALPGAVLTAAMLCAFPAFAQDGAGAAGPPREGYDLDINLVRPIFGSEILPGVDVPATERPGTVRGGLVFGYERNPLVLYQFDEEIGSVVANRFSMWAGASVDITRAFTARVVIPMYMQWGSEVPRYASDGFAIGDISVGAHLALLRRPTGGLGLRVDLTTPTSRKDFYAGERLPRLSPGIIAMGDIGRVRIAVDIGGNFRFARLDTTEEFSLGSELDGKLGIRYEAIPDRLKIGLTGYARFGFVNLLGAGETTGEALITAAYRPAKWLWVEVSGGRGFTRGYGSSDFRGFVQLRLQRVPRVKALFVDPEGTNNQGKQPLIWNGRFPPGINAEGDRFLTEAPGATIVVGDLDGERWDTGDTVKLDREKKQIRIRWALQFRVGTAQLLPESYPTLDAVADLMNGDPTIGHVVIEGHASPDGPYDRNFQLSVDRAQSIWRRLVEVGVHPTRLSFRGMGEVMPVDAAGGEDELQQSRRVVFHIVKQLSGGDQPEYLDTLAYPWNGEPYRPVIPSMPEDGESGTSLDREDLPEGLVVEEEEPAIDVQFDGEEAFEFDTTSDDVEVGPAPAEGSDAGTTPPAPDPSPPDDTDAQETAP